MTIVCLCYQNIVDYTPLRKTSPFHNFPQIIHRNFSLIVLLLFKENPQIDYKFYQMTL